MGCWGMWGGFPRIGEESRELSKEEREGAVGVWGGVCPLFGRAIGCY